jgi:hypothetical protein
MAAAVGAQSVLASHRAITRADANAIATAISVRHSDLPSLKQESNPTTAHEKALSAQATRCAGGVPVSKAYANTQSDLFVSSGQAVTIASGVEILPSASLVAQDFAAIQRSRALTCLLSEYQAAIGPSLSSGQKLISSRASRLPPALSGGEDNFAIRMTFVVAAKQGSTTVNVPVYLDELGFADGQAEISLELQTTLNTPAASLEQRLMRVLVARAQSAIG